MNKRWLLILLLISAAFTWPCWAALSICAVSIRVIITPHNASGGIKTAGREDSIAARLPNLPLETASALSDKALRIPSGN